MRRTSRAAITLVEMLVAMTITLIMMGAVVTLFGNVGNSITDSRSVMEISERLRNCRNVLQQDLGNVTVTMLPPRRPESDEGYFEYIERPDTDMTYYYPASSPAPQNNDYTGNGLPGDADDVLMFTMRSPGEPFVGKHGMSTITSHTAEVVWFTSAASPSGLPPVQVQYPDSPTRGTFALRTLYRRVFLVVPSIGRIAGTSAPAFYNQSDISVHADGPDLITNTLGELTKRECRSLHDWAAGFSYPVVATSLIPFDSASGRLGDDVILTNVLSFDVKAYDPAAEVRQSSGVAVMPSDPGYEVSGATPIAQGCYVDLNYNRYLSGTPNSYFSSAGDSQYSGSLLTTYDTWSMHYEQNGIDEDSALGPDTSTNGLDDNNNGIVDDPTEQEAPPPYPVPLRGVQIKIRVYEPDSRQVREVTVVQDFMPQ